MTKKIDLVGQNFGRWVVLSYAGNDPRRKKWTCRCSCGTEKIVREDHLRGNVSKSCGCLSAELAGMRLKASLKRHGHTTKHSISPTYRSWTAMKKRCTDASNNRFCAYGGRGITVCEEWLGSFEAFLEDMGERPDGATLDRINTDLGYCKDNCRWAPSDLQANNKRNSRYITYQGVTKTFTQWGVELFNSPRIIHYRKKAGWSDHDALSIAPDSRNRITPH